MEGIVFIPGIFGTSLYYDTAGGAPQQIWPPGPLDAAFGYQNLTELSDPDRVAIGNIVDFVVPPLMPEYNAIEADLRDISNRTNGSNNGPYLPVPYDWRMDLFAAAKYLEGQVSQWANGAGLSSITFVCHSMGGLVLRLMLESVIASQPANQKPAWLALAKRAVFACTPHLGAPGALVYALGVEGESTLSGPQLKQLGDDPAFPSGYQLIPAPTRNLLFDQSSGGWIPYARADVVAALGLSDKNLAAAAKERAQLNIANKPIGMEYFFMYGTGLETAQSLDVEGLTTSGAKVVLDENGDGTVPTWSITEAANTASPPIPTWSGPGEHLKLLSTDAFRQELYRYFGLGATAPMRETALALTRPAIDVHANKQQYAPGESMHILLIPSSPTETLAGTISVKALLADKDNAGAPRLTLADAPVASKTVKLEGGPIKTHAVRIAAPSAPGAYQLVFSGDNATHASPPNEGAWFFVRAKSDHPARGVTRRP